MEDVILENIWPNWHIEKLIGAGSFGSVYMAKRSGFDFEHDFYSAVKIIRVPSEDSEIRGLLADGMSTRQVAEYYESALRGLVSEIELMESLKGSPNIVTIEDYEVRKNADGIGWTIYIRMELLKNLNQYRTEHPLSVDDIVHLGIDMCSALEYCAKKQIVHRDIKPDNIFVNEFGDFKLGDFGIARHLEMTSAHLSQKGTSNYMAPEIYRGEPYNASVDIYSLGIVLYRLLNHGRLPFMPPYPKPISYEDNENAMARRLNGEPLPEPAQGGKLLADIVRRASSADINFRYNNPTDMKNDLIRWQVSGQHAQGAAVETGIIPPLDVETSLTGGNRSTSGTTDDFNKNTAGYGQAGFGGNGESAGTGQNQERTRYMFGEDQGAGFGPGGNVSYGYAQGYGGQGNAYGNQGYGNNAYSGHPNSGNAYGNSGNAYRNTAGASQNRGVSRSGAAEQKSGIKAWQIVLCCVSVVLVLFVIVYFCIPFGHGETLLSKTMYAISDTDTRFDSAMSKGDRAYDRGDYTEALYFYEERALAEKPRSLEAWIALLRTHTANLSVPADTTWNNMISDLEAIGNLQSSPDESGQQEIINAVNVYMDARGQEILDRLDQGDTSSAQADVMAFFDQYNQCTQAAAGKVDCGSDNAQWYLSFYSALSQIEGCEDYAQTLLAEGYGKYPEDEDLAALQGEVDKANIALGYEDINNALSAGDFDTAYARAQELYDTIGEEEYTSLVESIDYIKERTSYLNSLKSMLDSGDYSGIAHAVVAESDSGGISSCYLVDGIYKNSVSEGTGLLYDSNGLYYGGIQNDQRYGNGIQIKCYSDGSYEILEGTWDGQANGNCTYTWWISDGTQATVTGNFTDGYEDGTMTIAWRQDGMDFTATYTATMGTYTEIEKDESGASIYAIAYDAEGSSYWWSTTQLEGNGCFMN